MNVTDVTIPERLPVLAFDIETMRDESRVDLLPEPEVKYGNTKDPALRQKKLDDAVATQQTRLALDPHYSKVLAVGFAWRANGDIATESFILPVDGQESRLLADSIDVLRRTSRLVSFNGASFDIQVLRRRAVLLGLNVAADWQPSVNKYHVAHCRTADANEHAHTDMYQVLTQGEVGQGTSNPLSLKRTLHAYADRLLGLTPPYDHDKAELGDLWRAGRLEEIHDLVTWDAQTTLALYEKLAPFHP